MKTLLSTVAALALSAAGASATTILSGSSTGNFYYDASVPNMTFNGSASMSVFQPLNATRDYALHLDVTIDPEGPSGPFSFSDTLFITMNIADDLTIIASDPTKGEFSYGAYVIGKYFGLSQSGNTYSGQLQDVIASTYITNYLMSGVNLENAPDTRGTCEFDMSLTAPVPLPAGMPLLGAGLGAAALVARKRKKQAA